MNETVAFDQEKEVIMEGIIRKRSMKKVRMILGINSIGTFSKRLFQLFPTELVYYKEAGGYLFGRKAICLE